MATPRRTPCDQPFRSAQTVEVTTTTRAAPSRPEYLVRIATQHFGPWWFDRTTLTLNLLNDEGGHEYQLDIERCSSSARLLEAVTRLTTAPWATPEQVGWLLYGLTELVRPQESLCSGGEERGPDRKSVV